MTRAIPDFVVIGYITEDAGTGIGGVAYSALSALRLGKKVGVVSSVGKDTDLSALGGTTLLLKISEHNTKFENVYRDGKRHQRVLGLAPPIEISQIPTEWRYAPVVHIAPIAQEVPKAVCSIFKGLVGVSAQGWLRKWDDSGKVYMVEFDLKPNADVLIVSENDLVGHKPSFDGITIITRGSSGADIYQRNAHRCHIPAFETIEVDPTGAGDVFATAFLIRYHETHDIVDSGIFAACAASFVIERKGIKGVPFLNEVEARMNEYRMKIEV
jgi:bifunctional ADP-heptose synthase (sugar kinase/adenylyltransferase)